MPLHSRYIEYVTAIAKRDDMILLIAVYVLCAFALSYAISIFFQRVKREWVLVGMFYATLAVVGFIPIVAGH